MGGGQNSPPHTHTGGSIIIKGFSIFLGVKAPASNKLQLLVSYLENKQFVILSCTFPFQAGFSITFASGYPSSKIHYLTKNKFKHYCYQQGCGAALFWQPRLWLFSYAGGSGSGQKAALGRLRLHLNCDGFS